MQDDSFQRMFKMYAEKVKLDLKQLSFSFDGDKINPSQTPGDIGMEDDDIIEVHMKSCWSRLWPLDFGYLFMTVIDIY